MSQWSLGEVTSERANRRSGCNILFLAHRPSSSSFPAESASMADSWPATSGIVAARFGTGGTFIARRTCRRWPLRCSPEVGCLTRRGAIPLCYGLRAFRGKRRIGRRPLKGLLRRSATISRAQALASYEARRRGRRACAVLFEADASSIQQSTQSCIRVCRLAGYERSEVFKHNQLLSSEV